MMKNQGQQYGRLAPKTVTIAPWETVSVDLIGPWTCDVNEQQLEFKALTIMDTSTNLLEIIRIDNKTSANNITQQFATNTWLSRYPWPYK